jgi:UDP-N-acetylglucosamine 2-epimerase
MSVKQKQRVTVLVGTRPEAIKLSPVVLELRRFSENFDVELVATGQHRELAREALADFGLIPDLDLDVMQPGQDLNGLLSRLVAGLGQLFARSPQPDWVLIQGDTTTVLAGALAAFHQGIRVGHVEAGLRTGDLQRPFPEEANRRLAAVVTSLHFCATEQAKRNLLQEGTSPQSIIVTGNTGIDALLRMESQVGEEDLPKELQELGPYVLVTAHRRESFGEGMASLARGLVRLAKAHPDLHWVYPVHPNPRVVGPMREALGGLSQIVLTNPVPYRTMVRLMSRAEFLLTDSGGVQEEGPALGRPVVVMREVTERPEAVEAGGAVLVGTDEERMVAVVTDLIKRGETWNRMAQRRFPYGDGQAASRIREAIQNARS